MSRKFVKFLSLNLYNNRDIIKRFAGHSKWANIKHIKAQKDSQRALMFTKISRQIKIAVLGKKSVDDILFRFNQDLYL